MKFSLPFRIAFNSLGNCEATTYYICKCLNISVPRSSLKSKLEEHPDYPSLLSISDALIDFGVDNFALKTSAVSISKLPLPLIAQANIEDKDAFLVVTKFEKNEVIYFHEAKGGLVRTSPIDFEKIFTGIVLLASVKDDAGKLDYDINYKEERKKLFLNVFSAFILPIFTLLLCIFNSIGLGRLAIPKILYSFVTLIGVIVTIALLWFEVDQYNPFLAKICTLGKKTSCGTILNSKASKIFGFSWSQIGFTYFIGSLICLVVTTTNSSAILLLLSWINLATLPYIFFSIFYQAVSAKKWCLLCLIIQGVLAFQFIIALVFKLYSIPIAHVDYFDLLITIFSFIFSFIAVSLILPVLQNSKVNNKKRIELQRLKHNPKIFEALLKNQKQTLGTTENLGITLGNPHGKYKLIKVCNPYCGPCSRAHSVLEDLIVNNNEIFLQIIFTVSGEENDVKLPPVKHLLAIAELGDQAQTKRALDDWYLSAVKDYDSFALKYPINERLNNQRGKIEEMRDWCKANGISFTPTIFINGFQLPDIYSVNDLKYLVDF